MSPTKYSRRSVLTATASSAVLAATEAVAGRAPSPRTPGFETARVELCTPALDPRHDGLVVAHLTDLHLGPQTPLTRIQAAVAACAGADVLVLTGDFVTYAHGPIALFKSALGDRPPMATVACLGNHDHIVSAGDVRRDLERLDMVVLQNEHTVLTVRGAPLQVIGVDDGTTRHDDVAKSFAGTRADQSRLVLTHSPPTAKKLPRDEGLVCLSGHTHGGAVHFGAVTNAVFRLLGQPYVRGLYPVEGNHLYVNRGLGSPIRIHSDPELTLFTLRSTREAA